jgi:hypothetical protein
MVEALTQEGTFASRSNMLQKLGPSVCSRRAIWRHLKLSRPEHFNANHVQGTVMKTIEKKLPKYDVKEKCDYK